MKKYFLLITIITFALFANLVWYVYIITNINQVAGLITAEATVTDIDLDDNLICNPLCNKNPRDYVYVKFERIIQIDDHIKEDVNLDLNKEYRVETDCTARGSIRRWYPIETEITDFSAFREGDNIVCIGRSVRFKNITDILMSELKIGDKIQSKFNYYVNTGEFIDMEPYQIV